MLSPACLTPAWIRAKADELKPVDPLLLEKCIHALALLGHLSESGSHLIQHRFGLDEVRIAAGKAALLATAMLTNRSQLDLAPLRYVESQASSERMKGQNIVKADWQLLNRIKQTNPAAFHYWLAADALNRLPVETRDDPHAGIDSQTNSKLLNDIFHK